MRGDILDCVDCESLPDSPPKWVICTNGLTYQGPIANFTRKSWSHNFEVDLKRDEGLYDYQEAKIYFFVVSQPRNRQTEKGQKDQAGILE